MNQFIDILAPGYSVSIVLFIISNHLIEQPFENDTVITLAIKSAEILLGQPDTTIDKTKHYCIDNKLALNKSKIIQIMLCSQKTET